MSDAVERLVSSTRTGLNSLLAAASALDWAWKAALGAAAAILPLRFLGLGRIGVALWLLLVAAAALAGFLRSLPRRLGSAQAARWLDERFGDGELLSAAIVCKERGSSGRFDGEILESANAFASEARAPRLPARALAVKSAYVAGLCLACLASLSLAGPARGAKAKYPSLLEGEGSAASVLEDMALRPDSFQGKEARDMAYRLFPRDKRMASLTEKALRDGRIDDLRKLLDRAEKDFQKRADSARSELEREELGEQLAMFQEAVRRGLGNEGGNGGGGAGEDPGRREEGGGAQKGLPDGAQGGAREGGAREGGAGGADDGGGAAADGGGAREDGGKNGKEGAGDGIEGGDGAREGAGKYKPGAGDPGSGTPRKGKPDGSNESLKKSGEAGFGEAAGVLKLDERGMKDGAVQELDIGRNDADEQMREMILPESEASGTGSRPVFDASRSGESAAARKDLPLEYRDYTRSYFMRLTEGDVE